MRREPAPRASSPPQTAGQASVFIGRPSVTIIIVNFNSGPWLGRTLRRLAKQSVRDFRTIVVDNASSDGSERACRDHPYVDMVQAGSNLGYAAANNLAVRRSETQWVLLLNPDALPDRSWLERMLAQAEARSEYRIFGCQQVSALEPELLDGIGDVVSAYGVTWRKGYLEKRRPVADAPSFSVCGAALLIRQDDFLALGGFDERFFCYVEDIDLCYRARLRGMNCWQIGDARVFHACGTSSLRGVNTFAIYHGYRNLLWMLVKNTPTALLPLSLAGYAAIVFAKTLIAPSMAARKAYFGGFIDAVRGIGTFWRARREVQTGRTASTWEIGRALSWNPFDIPFTRTGWRRLLPARFRKTPQRRKRVGP